MRIDTEQIRADFLAIRPQLEITAEAIEVHLKDVLKDANAIDRITCRVKGESSFVNKVTNMDSTGKPKYNVPMKEIQDFIGARIIVYYKSDVEDVAKIISNRFNFVEEHRFVPEDVSAFGYEGVHFICFIPNFIMPNEKSPLLPDFFELQIKTLYQHAWSQSQHGLGYKPYTVLSNEEKRKLAFISAQSWGADTILDEIIRKQKNLTTT